MAYDLLIKNGRVVDGSGGPSFKADVAVKDGKIVGIGRFNESATRIIDADGRVVAPGFIDHHTHYDPQALYDPLCSSTAQNGNTTVIVGQCGQVLAPARPEDRDWYLEFFAYREDVPLSAMRKGIDFTWESIPEYLDALGRNRGVNAGALIGHSGLRRYVMGEEASERVEATPEEIDTMKRLTREGMLAGALGFSTGSGLRNCHRRRAIRFGRRTGRAGHGHFSGKRRLHRRRFRAAGSGQGAIHPDRPPRDLQSGVPADKRST